MRIMPVMTQGAGPDEVTQDAATEGSAFECENVCLTVETARGPLQVLEAVSFSVAPGEFVSIVGKSGSGKSTLLRVLGGLQTPSGGSTVLYRGTEVTGPPDGVVVLFQDYSGSLLPWRTVEKNVMLGLEGKFDSDVRRERCREALDLVGLADRRRDYPRQLSGGMQQRVQIARSLAMRPEALLMDEPFGALDAMTKAQLQDELQTVHGVTNATIVFVTHDIEEAVYLSDRVMVLAQAPARIVADVAVDLPRPRDQIATRELPDYLECRHQVHMALRAGEGG